MKISSKIIAISLALVALSTAAFLGTVLVQRGRMFSRMNSLVREQARTETGKTVQTVYYNCVSAEAQNQRRLIHDLAIAREILDRAGQVSLGTNSVRWNAVNQFTGKSELVHLPGLQAGGKWLGQNTDTNIPSPVVDDIRHLTRDHGTIFQRMNDEGDMLRVDTSVVAFNGSRAVGTFIPHQNADGSGNAVIAKVLKGETYRGRAFVVNEYHDAAYEPIWDPGKHRVIGMLYVGVSIADLGKELHDAITKIVVGKSGYVYVLDSKGVYQVSQRGERDGESVWESKDADGRAIIQSIVQKARDTSNGFVSNQSYSWKNSGESAARNKFAAFTYFATWDWIIAAGAYDDDYEDVASQVAGAIGLGSLVKWCCLTALCVGMVAFAASFQLSGGLTSPILRAIDNLGAGTAQTVAAAEHLSSSSQFLAEGAGKQAAALEQTTSSLEEMSAMTKRNAENARKANELARQARAAADRSAIDMQAMDGAMGAIKASSDDIAKIIKTIDEIAFQTNILALNAAVEAARAGEAGMGFAVVADEVRNLAQRSAQAAKETAGKIEGAMVKTGQGIEISGKVAQTLSDIVAKARQVDDLVAELSSAASEQTQGIAQINAAVGEIDKVTQSNAARAEESASAAEELKAQAGSMNDSVAALLKLATGRDQTATARARLEPTEENLAGQTFVGEENGPAARKPVLARDGRRGRLPGRASTSPSRIVPRSQPSVVNPISVGRQS